MDLDSVLDYSESVAVRLERNPLLSFNHLPGPNGTRPGPAEQFHKCQSKIKGLMGGNRSGKSEEGAEYMLARAMELPNGRGWACCPSAEMSIEVQQRKVWKLLPKDEIQYAKYDSINGFTHNKLVLKNGFTLLFKSYEMGAEKFASDDVDIIWDDEEPPYEIYKEQIMRTLDRGGELYFTLTPLFGYTKFVEEVLLKKQTVLGHQVRVFTMRTEDNVHLNSEQLELIMSQIDDEDKPARLHGLPVNKQGLVYSMWKDQSPHVVTIDQWEKVKDHTSRFTAIDPHNRTPSAVGFYGVDREGRFWLFDEIYDHLLVPELAKRILEKEGKAVPEFRVIDNSAQIQDLADGKSLRMQLFEVGVSTILAKKDNKNSSSIALMRQMLTIPKDGGLPMFVVVENCIRSRFEFQRYSWASYASDKMEERLDPKQDVRKKNDHIMDCNHYIIRSGANYYGNDRSAEIAADNEAMLGAIEVVARETCRDRPINPIEYYTVV